MFWEKREGRGHKFPAPPVAEHGSADLEHRAGNSYRNGDHARKAEHDALLADGMTGIK
jgi:hypothetical protein